MGQHGPCTAAGASRPAAAALLHPPLLLCHSFACCSTSTQSTIPSPWNPARTQPTTDPPQTPHLNPLFPPPQFTTFAPAALAPYMLLLLLGFFDPLIRTLSRLFRRSVKLTVCAGGAVRWY